MKLKHLIAWTLYFSLLASLLLLMGCHKIPRKNWVCRHYVSSFGEIYYKSGKKIDIVFGVTKGEHISDNIYKWTPHVKIEGERYLDTASDLEFVEVNRWRLNQGYVQDELNFKRFVMIINKEDM